MFLFSPSCQEKNIGKWTAKAKKWVSQISLKTSYHWLFVGKLELTRKRKPSVNLLHIPVLKPAIDKKPKKEIQIQM